MSNQELEIVRLIHENSRKGLEELFEKYSNKFYSYCVFSWGFTEDEAWDVIYATLETIVDSIKGYEFDSTRHFENFIFKVFKNNLRQSHRKRKAVLEHIQFVPLEMEEIDSEAQDLLLSMSDENSKMTNPQIELLNQALSELSSTDKELLLLRGQNFSYDQIAKFLGIENSQLKVKAHRAKKKLLELMIKLQKHSNEH